MIVVAKFCNYSEMFEIFLTVSTLSLDYVQNQQSTRASCGSFQILEANLEAAVKGEFCSFWGTRDTGTFIEKWGCNKYVVWLHWSLFCQPLSMSEPVNYGSTNDLVWNNPSFVLVWSIYDLFIKNMFGHIQSCQTEK